MEAFQGKEINALSAQEKNEKFSHPKTDPSYQSDFHGKDSFCSLLNRHILFIFAETNVQVSYLPIMEKVGEKEKSRKYQQRLVTEQVGASFQE